jgi:hypothetical protein
MNWLTGVLQRFRRLINSSTDDMVDASYDECYNISYLRNNPIARETLMKSSIYEDEHNSQYSGMLNTLSNHCVGTIPLPVPMSDIETLDDAIEDRWFEWGRYNKVGSALRQARRKAAQGGIAVLIPYKSASDYDLKLAYRVIGAEHLKSPRNVRYGLDDPFVNKHTGQHVEGVEFWPNGEVRRVWVQEEYKLDPTPYDVGKGKAIVWIKESRPFPYFPEMTPAFHIIPSMTRFLTNVLREQEFKSAIPMAVKLDWNVYGGQKAAPPKGAFKYEPGMIPTLPPGTDLVGVAMQSMAEDRARMSDKFCAVGARCIDMPKNLALADSSDSNMATSHIDLQPWKYVVDIDRYDYESVVFQVYNQWYEMASSSPLLPSVAFETRPPPTLFNYTVIFNHPDPQKNATARATDLVSGASTLSMIYSEQSKNARREIKKEARLYNVSVEKYLQILLASRSKQALEVLNATTKDQDANEAGSEFVAT